jgi:uncharacterized membrane protein
MRTSKPISRPRLRVRDANQLRTGERLLTVSGVLAILGIAVAAYLTIVHYRSDLLVCAVGSACHTVQNSSYAVVFGIPVALLGLGMYLLLLGLVGVRYRNPRWHETATMLAFALAFAGVIYAGYLTYVELFVIDAICQWCVISAALTVAIAVIEGIGVWRILGASPCADS